MKLTLELPAIGGALSHELRLGPPIQSRAPLEELLRYAGETADEELPLFVGSPRSRSVLSVPGRGARRRERELSGGEYDPFNSILSQVRDLQQFPEITALATYYSACRIYSEWTFGRHSALRDPTLAGRSDTKLSERMDNLALALNALEQSITHEQIRALLAELKETYSDYVTRVIFGRVGLELLESPFDTPLPAKRLSDGTLRFLALAAILLHPDPPPLICLEEPELGMHPDMIRIVSEMIVSAAQKTQIIVTTHSEYLLSSLENEFDVLYAFNSGLSGSVTTRFTRSQLKEWREEHSLGQLWTSGELGGNRW
jgi:predicted ATPase